MQFSYPSVLNIYHCELIFVVVVSVILLVAFIENTKYIATET